MNNHETLEHLARMAGSAPSESMKIPNGRRNKDLIRGHFSAHRCPSGILLHTMEAREMRDLENTLRLSPCLNFCVLLSGGIDFRLDANRYHFESDEFHTSAFAMNLVAPSNWTRILLNDRFVSKVVVSLPYEWIANRRQHGLSFSAQLETLTQRHNHVFRWQTDSELTSISRSLRSLSQAEPNDLVLESKALEFLSHCFRQTSSLLPTNDSTTNAEYAQNQTHARRIQEYLEKNIVANPSRLKPHLDELSSVLGMSKSSLQRNFKQQFNMTIFDYIRVRKLENARDYLKQSDSSIGEAAYRAGYKHGPNFSKAFKQAFGLTPGEFLKHKD